MERKTVTDIIERLRRYNGPWLVPAEAADEIEKLRGEVAALNAQHDNEVRQAVIDTVEIERLRGEVALMKEDLDAAIGDARYFEKQRDALEFQMNEFHNIDDVVEIRTLKAERDAAVALLQEVNERFIYKGRGSTHWEGCEESHPDCAMAKRIEAVHRRGARREVMTRDEVMLLANKTAGQSWMDEAHIQRFAALVAAHEREACAETAMCFVNGGQEIANAIRARGNV